MQLSGSLTTGCMHKDQCILGSKLRNNESLAEKTPRGLIATEEYHQTIPRKKNPIKIWVRVRILLCSPNKDLRLHRKHIITSTTHAVTPSWCFFSSSAVALHAGQQMRNLRLVNILPKYDTFLLTLNKHEMSQIWIKISRRAYTVCVAGNDKWRKCDPILS